MKAAVGDRLHFLGNVVGVSDHSAVVVESRGEAGEPPYLIRYDDGHETVVFPGADCRVEHVTADDPSGT